MKCDYCERSDPEYRIRTIMGINYCPRHLTRYYRKQDINGTSIYDPNEYILYDDHAEMILKDKHGNVSARAIIDLEDVDRCKLYKWHARKSKNSNLYVIASLKNNVKIHLHRYIMNYDGEMDVDHINRNPLDNRKNNLRIVTHAQNSANNGKDGVAVTSSGKWVASVMRDYKNIYIGTFLSREEAINARKSFVAQLNLVGQ